MMDFQPKLKNTIGVAVVMAAVVLSYAFTIAKPADDPIDKLIAALQKWSADKPHEKVYLHLDKPYYALGDTIWFKGYVTTGSKHQLSAMSGALYVDLINERDSVVRDLKLPITTGMVMGDLVLGDDLHEGNYRIRAYTQWMRNAGEAWYFDKTFTVGSVISNGIITKADYQYKDVDGKQVLTATLNYSDEQGKPIAGKDILYRIVINKKVVWTKSAKTDADGNIPVNIANQNKVDLAGAYIRTTLNNSSNKEITKDFPIKASLSQSDVQLFPESGNMVNGVTSRVGFKVTGVDGLGLTVTGKVVDNENKEVTTFSTLNAGMGHFILRPEAGKTYTAKISFADGAIKSVTLPQANDNGYVLSVFQPGTDSVSVRISTTQQQASQPKNVALMVQAGGETIFATNIIVDKPMKSVWLDRKAFPSGIAQFTLFDAAGIPLNERIAFIKRNDRLNLDIKPNKTSYKSKEQVAINLTAKDGDGKTTAGNFSVSVIDESKIPSDEVNETSIFSSLLLTSDIKGYVEKPNYYFINDNEATDQALDNLMLTQGYRRFVWQDIIRPDTTSNTKTIFQYPAEGIGVAISGKVHTLAGKPAPGTTVTLMSTKARITKFADTDAEGKFKFEGIFLTDSIKFAVQARTKKNSAKLMVILDSIPTQKVTRNPNPGDLTTNIPGTLRAYIEAGKKQDEINIKMGRMDRVHTLREVSIRGAKDKKDADYNPVFQGPLRIDDAMANKTIVIKDGDKQVNLANYLQSSLPGVMFQPYKSGEFDAEIPNYPHTMARKPFPAMPLRVILNGRLLSLQEGAGVFDNSLVDVADVMKVNFVAQNPALQAVYGVDDPNTAGTGKPDIGILFLYTRRPDQRKIYDPSMVNITPKGFNKAREFYSPRYDRPSDDMRLPDMRTTIYWNPYLKTYSGGKGFFSFYNADGPGTYRVTIEGINADGQLGRQVIRYQVDGDMAANTSVPTLAKGSGAKKQTDALAALQKDQPVEKVYIHMDKPYYTLGDTLWFKGYVTKGSRNEASTLSGAVYVDLINEHDSLVRTIKLPAANGMIKGDMLLGDDLDEGNYRLRAYTQWMRNAGEEYFFDRTFTVGSVFSNGIITRANYQYTAVDGKPLLTGTLNYTDDKGKPLVNKHITYRVTISKNVVLTKSGETDVQGNLAVKIPNDNNADLAGAYIRTTLNNSSNKEIIRDIPIKAALTQSDVQFFPEGGNMVYGINSRVAFKVTGTDGLGTDVTGKVLDNTNNEVAQLRTLHAGMGSFTFTPEAGRNYTAVISFADGSTKYTPLPKAMADGYRLAVSQNKKDSVTVNINAPAAQVQGKALSIVAQTGGEAIYASAIKLTGGSAVVSIDKKLFPGGIAQFTLFGNDEPLNERIAFIKNSNKLQLSLKPNKGSYQSKEQVSVGIEAMDSSGKPVAGNYSVSVIDESKIPFDDSNASSIFSHLLLSSDIKGFIEQPGYYFNNDTEESTAALDNLMLTQGYRRFKWTELLDSVSEAKPKFVTEGLGVTVAGKVVTLTKKPMANATVSLVSTRGGIAKTATTDGEGRFKFAPIFMTDSLKFAVQARTQTNSDKAIITLDTIPKLKIGKNPNIYDVNTNIAVTLKAYIDAGKKQDELNLKMGRMDKVHRLREVNIKGTTDKKPEIFIQGPLRIPEGHENKSYTMKEEDAFATLNLSLAGKLGAAMFTGRGAPLFQGIPMEVILNGRKLTNPEEISDLFDGNTDPLDVLKVDAIWTKGSPLYPMLSVVGPVILVYTKPNYQRKPPYNPAIVNIAPKGFNKTREFYTPKYDKPGKYKQLPDMRTTIHWDPNVKTDLAGGGNVSFYTGDGPATYKLLIEGIGADGQLGRQILRFTVDGELFNGTAPDMIFNPRWLAVK